MKRTPTHIRRLNRLADFLDTLPDKLFDFRQYINVGENRPEKALEVGGGCGTTACAVGWAPAVFPSLLKWDLEAGEVCYRGENRLGDDDGSLDRESHHTAMDFFGLSDMEATWLFVPRGLWESSGRLSGDASPRRVAAHIRKFLVSGVPESYAAIH
jgi:hypothetical protein